MAELIFINKKNGDDNNNRHANLQSWKCTNLLCQKCSPTFSDEL